MIIIDYVRFWVEAYLTVFWPMIHNYSTSFKNNHRRWRFYDWVIYYNATRDVIRSYGDSLVQHTMRVTIDYIQLEHSIDKQFQLFTYLKFTE